VTCPHLGSVPNPNRSMNLEKFPLPLKF